MLFLYLYAKVDNQLFHSFDPDQKSKMLLIKINVPGSLGSVCRMINSKLIHTDSVSDKEFILSA